MPPQIVAAAEAAPLRRCRRRWPSAKGLLLIQGMNGIADDPDLLVRLSRVFGPEVEDYRRNLTDLKPVHVSVPEILLVSNMAPVSKAPPKRPEPPLTADGLIPVQYPHRKGWHTDQSYRRPPPDISLFYAVTPADAGPRPDACSPTACWPTRRCRPTSRPKVDTLEGLHAQPGSGRSREAALAGRTPRAFAVHERSQPQPVVRTHPVTGEEGALFSANGARWTGSRARSSAWSPARTAAGAALLDEIMAHYTRAGVLLRPRMDVGDLAGVGQSLPLAIHAATWFRRRQGAAPDAQVRRCAAIPGALYAGEAKSWLRLRP